MPVGDDGNGDEELWWTSLLTACHKHFGLSETEETKLEKYCFGSEDEFMVLVTKWFESRPVKSRGVSAFTQVSNSWSEVEENRSELKTGFGFAFG